MAVRVDTSSWLPGRVLIGGFGFGVKAEDIPSAGANGPSFLYASVSLPEDAGKEFCGRIVEWPSAGTLDVAEDGAFEFAAPDGAYQFRFQLLVDAQPVGEPQTVALLVGAPAAELAGVANATAVGSGTLAGTGADLGGTAAAVASAIGALGGVAAELAGVAMAETTASGTLHGSTAELAGSVAAEVTAAGTLSLGAQTLEGAALAGATASAGLTVANAEVIPAVRRRRAASKQRRPSFVG
jgi:hypothetical protein